MAASKTRWKFSQHSFIWRVEILFMHVILHFCICDDFIPAALLMVISSSGEGVGF